MSKPEFEGYDPNGVGQSNGNFLGLPRAQKPAVNLIAVPYDATVSYTAGTAQGPENILAASTQLDVCIPGLIKPWEIGFNWNVLSCDALSQNSRDRDYAKKIIDKLENGFQLSNSDLRAYLDIKRSGELIASSLKETVSKCFTQNQFPAVIGGEHAISLGAFQAADQTGTWGILQLDAHFDLRSAYEGFHYSHASVMYNALQTCKNLERIVAVGIRDYCPEEETRVANSNQRVIPFYDRDLQLAKITGTSFSAYSKLIVRQLPQRVWVSFDIDGLDPSLCANTGTPVASGLLFQESLYLIQQIIESGRTIIGLDLVEVAGPPFEYEGAVGARLVYEICSRAVLAR